MAERHILYHTEPDRACGGYRTALAQAIRAFAGITIEDLPRRAGALVTHIAGGRVVELDFLGRRAVIEIPDCSIYFSPDRGEVPVWARILILHYLARANGAPRRGIDATFRDLEGGREYFPAFEKRAISPFVLMFGNEPDRFIEAGLAAGGERTDTGLFSLQAEQTGISPFSACGKACFDEAIRLIAEHKHKGGYRPFFERGKVFPAAFKIAEGRVNAATRRAVCAREVVKDKNPRPYRHLAAIRRKIDRTIRYFNNCSSAEKIEFDHAAACDVSHQSAGAARQIFDGDACECPDRLSKGGTIAPACSVRFGVVEDMSFSHVHCLSPERECAARCA